eukprot:4340048-Pyramimonas_sp.AAC.1
MGSSRSKKRRRRRTGLASVWKGRQAEEARGPASLISLIFLRKRSEYRAIDAIEAAIRQKRVGKEN